MKKLSVLFFLLILSSQIWAQADNVIGYWLTEEDKSQVRIYRAKNGKYYGKIIWLNEPLNEKGKPKKDINNPDKKKRERPVKGLLILRGFEYDKSDEEWDDGTIYDPENGNTYKCYMWFEDGNTNKLHVKGYIGFSLIGRETTWKRENTKRTD